MDEHEMNEPITEEWLKSVGFKWHQLERQPSKHWVLWLGGALGRMSSHDDLGIEMAYDYHAYKPEESFWFCWLRSDVAGRYHRFIHIRHITTKGELMQLVESLSGQLWDAANHLYGNVYTPEHAERLRDEDERYDRVLMRGRAKWSEIENDDTRGRALPEHYIAHEKEKDAGDS